MIAVPLEFLQRAGFLILQVPVASSEKAFARIPGMLGDKLGAVGSPPLSGIVVNFSKTTDLKESAWTEFASRLASIPGRHDFFAVGVPTAMQALVKAKDAGLEFEFFENIDAVFEKLGERRAAHKPAGSVAKAKSKADVELEKLFIRTFQEVAVKTLAVQCETVFKPLDTYVKTPKNKVVHDIAASMGMMSKTVSGSVALGFHESTYLKVMSKMLGEEQKEITSEVEDGCGELLNIIFGQAKKTFNENGHLFGKTLPTIFLGDSLKVRQLTPSPSFVVPFDSEYGQMVIEIGYRRTA